MYFCNLLGICVVPTWATTGVKTAKNRQAMARAQRTTALRTIRSYRTVSGEASTVLATMIAAVLLAHDRARVKTRRDGGEPPTPTAVIKSEERKISIRAWQARWDRTATTPDAVGRKWTHRLIPNLARWLAKPKLVMTYHLTQAMSGHGCFRSYLAKMNRADDSYCGNCMDPDDTAEPR